MHILARDTYTGNKKPYIDPNPLYTAYIVLFNGLLALYQLLV